MQINTDIQKRYINGGVIRTVTTSYIDPEGLVDDYALINEDFTSTDVIQSRLVIAQQQIDDNTAVVADLTIDQSSIPSVDNLGVRQQNVV